MQVVGCKATKREGLYILEKCAWTMSCAPKKVAPPQLEMTTLILITPGPTPPQLSTQPPPQSPCRNDERTLPRHSPRPP